MSDVLPALVVAMVATRKGVVFPDYFPVYLVLPEHVGEFKEKYDGAVPGLVWIPLDNVNDLRGPLPRKLPRR